MKFHNIEDPEEVIEILKFNYDGKGSALGILSSSTTIEHIPLEEVKELLIGTNKNLPKYELLKETPNQK